MRRQSHTITYGTEQMTGVWLAVHNLSFVLSGLENRTSLRIWSGIFVPYVDPGQQKGTNKQMTGRHVLWE